MEIRKVEKVSRESEPDMNERIWVAITAHKPLARLNSLINVLNEYLRYPFDIAVKIYIDYDSQDDVELLENVLEPYKKLNEQVVVAAPGYENWYLTWAHKTDLALEILNRRADFYIYQENDMLITLENFLYWRKWRPVLGRRGLEPGFIRFERFEDLKVPFDNHYVYSLTKETPNVWSGVGFTVPKILVVDYDIDFFVQVANPYYGAMLLNQEDGEKYIRSDSYDPERSYSKVGIRNWPIADRSSMGLAFEDIPSGLEHRRCVPVIKEGGSYVPHPVGLLEHDDHKYAPELKQKNLDILDCSQMFQLL